MRNQALRQPLPLLQLIVDVVGPFQVVSSVNSVNVHQIGSDTAIR